MVIAPISLAIVAFVLSAMAEVLHARRVHRVNRLVFGPEGSSSWVSKAAPALRAVSLASLTWGLTTLLELPPKGHGHAEIPKSQRQHLMIALDVSPSMRAKDAGQKHDQSRMRRASEVLESIFSRSDMSGITVSVVAFYTKAIPVVVQSIDMEVTRRIMNDLPLHYMFSPGHTDILAGIETSVQLAKDWPLNSTTLMVVTDGDTIPAVKMPVLPPSVKDIVLIGVGDPTNGTRVNSELSRQNVDALRQVAQRTGGEYYNANDRNLSTNVLQSLAISAPRLKAGRWTLREWALLCVVGGGLINAAVPVWLALFGSSWHPGTSRSAFRKSRQSLGGSLLSLAPVLPGRG